VPIATEANKPRPKYAYKTALLGLLPFTNYSLTVTTAVGCHWLTLVAYFKDLTY